MAVLEVGFGFYQLAMKTTRITRDNDNATICERCQIADNVLTRVRGLLGRAGLAEDEGLLIIPCPSIHMFGMKFALDVVFLTREFVVVDLIENIAPGKAYVAKKTHGKAHSALELSVGTIARHNIEIGQTLSRD